MQIKMIINGVDFSRWAKEEGITQSVLLRQSRSVTALDGILYKAEVEKRGIEIQLVELRDATLEGLMASITPKSTVEYTDMTRGDKTAKFYASVTAGSAKRVVGGNTYYSGVTVQLEEM